MNNDDVYNGMRIHVTGRRLQRDNVIVYDVQVTDMNFKVLWSYTVTTTRDYAKKVAQRWIDGKDRSVGFTY